VPAVAAAVLIGLGPGAASASACAGWTVQTTPNPASVDNLLNGVAATSTSNAWAVGNYSNSDQGFPARSLIVHWNGSAWRQQSSPSPGSGVNNLSGVAATSATNAWAVGSYDNSANTSTQTLIVHWNGTAWQQVPSPSPGGPGAGHASALNGIVATSATDAWAVGYYINSTTHLSQALIVHWNGTSWQQVPSPDVGIESGLGGVAATSATNVWAVGSYPNRFATGNRTLVVHWNGTAWQQVPSPNPHSCEDSNGLSGVAATSATNAWAVGSDDMCPGSETENLVTLILHWNGTSWRQQASPRPSVGGLHGVAATSATNAWAVGTVVVTGLTLTAHWNGTAWQRVPSPNPAPHPGFDELGGVAATSATNTWAVGSYTKAGQAVARTLVLHHC
jgi:hypothetical protein